MREILFRGKRVDNGEWVEGSLVVSQDRINYGKCYMTSSVCDFSYGDNGDRIRLGCFVEVIPETVGQFTGLLDKNGKRIFEGDILSERPDCNKEAYIGYVEWDDKEALWRFRFPDNLEYFAALGTYSTSYKVIGTIYDNPELLEEL